MNIYMVHLMFSKYWFPDAFYSISSPVLIFIAILLEERMTKTVERDSLNSYKIES